MTRQPLTDPDQANVCLVDLGDRVHPLCFTQLQDRPAAHPLAGIGEDAQHLTIHRSPQESAFQPGTGQGHFLFQGLDLDGPLGTQQVGACRLDPGPALLQSNLVIGLEGQQLGALHFELLT